MAEGATGLQVYPPRSIPNRVGVGGGINYFEGLKSDEQAFVLYYCQDPYVAKAARRAGIAESTGAKLMKTTPVIGAIEQKLSERNQRLEVDSDWLLVELLKAYHADTSELFDEKTNALLPIHKWPEHWRKLTVGLKTREEFGKDPSGNSVSIGQTIDAKLPDKIKLMELIGKHINVRAFTEQLIQTTEADLAERLARGRKRMNQRLAELDPEKKVSFL